MSQNPLLEQKIIHLVLSQRGHSVAADVLTLVSREPTISGQLTQLIKQIDSLVQNSAVLGNESDNSAADPVLSTPSVSEPFKADEAEPEPSVSNATEKPELKTTTDIEPVTPIWKLMPFYELGKQTKNDVEVQTSPALSPGQVPINPQRSGLTLQLTAPPKARVAIPNARVGERFSSPVAIALDDGQKATISNVVFPRDIGISFEKEQQLLTGTPTESGDIDISVLWSCPSHQDCETKLLFVVNPDPRSLWKVIDPPEDAPYRKAHLESSGLSMDGVRIAAASRRGRSHEHSGSFRDDDFYVNLSHDTGWSIMLVADGAGSAVNSREGSRIAVKTAGDYLFNQLNGLNGVNLKKHIAAWEGSDQQTTKDFMLHHFKQAATLAVNSIQNEAICAELPVKSYSTTLLATIALRTDTELFAAAFWLGDGAIGAYSPSGKVRILGNPDSGEYAGQTRFLDQTIIADASFTGRISVGKWSDVSHLILMTDGVSDPLFETDNGLRSDAKWTRLVNELSPLLADANMAPGRLGDWLNFFSTGNHDDRTIAVMW